jgi:hypothetical protein
MDRHPISARGINDDGSARRAADSQNSHGARRRAFS